ncbi:MAG: fused MFS/spermidine synthase [Verrucomicrobiae bacterium]|nr:fused MFS/spermidine synthase [Verrucomicrobiae bacterium]
MAAFGVSVFLSAFLFFHLQPLTGRYLLPAFGGGPAVWSVCLVFYQGLLLAGYVWAHGILTLHSARRQQLAHAALCAAAVTTLPLRPQIEIAANLDPTLAVLLLLAKSIGLPGLALAATAPLAQAWFARTDPRRSPYRLYALSNAASLLALLMAATVSDLVFTRAEQCGIWSLLFIVQAAAILWAGTRKPGSARPEPRVQGDSRAISGRTRLLWWLLPFCGSALLLSTTARLTADFAVVPLLWTLPLAVYLLTWILAFDHPRWYRRPLIGRLLPIALLLVWIAAFPSRLPGGPGFAVLTPIFLAGFFVAVFFCHGELFRLRPESDGLSPYYIAIAGGGLLGSAFTGLLAPRIFSIPLELPFCLLLCGSIGVAIRLREHPPQLERPDSLGHATYLIGGLAVYALLWIATVWGTRDGILRSERNFFGVAAVREQTLGSPTNHAHLLVHGATIHGLQFQQAQRRREATTYFGPKSGFALIWNEVARRENLRIGVIGLGAGTLAAYGRVGDRFRFYEINPLIVKLAREEFTFLSDSAAPSEFVLGDARINLDHETSNGFDLLVLDAFNGGAIPVHLLTLEAFAIYRRHLAPGGVIALHATNRHLDLGPVVRSAAAELGMTVRHFSARPSWTETRDKGSRGSDWYGLDSADPGPSEPAMKPWSDEHASLLPLLK